MHTVEIEEAEKQLSKLVDEAVNGESFVIAKDGKPLVKVEALHADSIPRRIGFLAGEIAYPTTLIEWGRKRSPRCSEPKCEVSACAREGARNKLAPRSARG